MRCVRAPKGLSLEEALNEVIDVVAEHEAEHDNNCPDKY